MRMSAVRVLRLFGVFSIAAVLSFPGNCAVFGAAGVHSSALPVRAQLLDLFPAEDGAVLHRRIQEKGRPIIEVVEGEALGRVSRFLEHLPAQDPEGSSALALRSFLSMRMDPRYLENNAFLNREKKGLLRLTALGRSALFDVITAQDGDLWEESEASAPAADKRTDGRTAGMTAPLSFSAAQRAAAAAEDVFDGSGHRLGGFEWGSVGTLSAAGHAAKAPAVAAMFQGYAVDHGRGTLRMLVSGMHPAPDRFRIAREESAQALQDSGFDERLFARYGARAVRRVDGLVAVDVPLKQASSLGAALAQRGIESRPARVFRAAASAVTGTAGAFLGTGLIPIPAMQGRGDFCSLLGASALWDAGMRGRGALVGVIDSGVDPEHPDFKDAQGRSRIRFFRDFTDEGPDDIVGHGTHVAGILAGDGAFSQGRRSGMSPEAELKVAKIFGSKGETDESVILAAMKWMVSGTPEEQVDVLNMSLAGPGAQQDPLTSMADRLVARYGVLMVAAAGNDGAAGWRTVLSPGDARYALSVSGVRSTGDFPLFASKGPAYGGDSEPYNKPDLSAVAGDVALPAGRTEHPLMVRALLRARDAGVLAQVFGPVPEGVCIYSSDGIIAPRSAHDPDQDCIVAGEPGYRYMSGTSMAAPMVSGAGADVIGFLKESGLPRDVWSTRALLLESAMDMGAPREQQGAGLLECRRMAQAVSERAVLGLPVGNVALALSMRLTSADADLLLRQGRYALTALGLLDTWENRIVNTEKRLREALDELRHGRRIIFA
ncbi:MAG: S8 family serine peptidase [Elusimicrobiota bacterium]|jgi:subtilisin family serine protease